MAKKQSEKPAAPAASTSGDSQPKADAKPKAAKKSSVSYFRNTKHSSLRVIVQDEKDPEQITEEAQFVPYYDTWKGDTVRVGYLKTDSDVIAKRCENDPTCESISEKEYNVAIEGDGNKNKPLRRAPTAIA